MLVPTTAHLAAGSFLGQSRPKIRPADHDNGLARWAGRAMRRKIVCVGNVVHEQFFQVEEMPRPGSKVGALGTHQRFGGPAATAAVAICCLGGAAAYWGRVGADQAGDACRAALQQHGVECSAVSALPDGTTLRSVVIVDRTGERTIITNRHGLPNDPSILSAHSLDGVCAILVDSRWPAGGNAALDRAAAGGIPSVFDADGGVTVDVQALIDKADHVVFSTEGLHQHAGEGDCAELLRRCGAGSGRVFGVTRGVEGSLWLIRDELFAVPAFRVTASDTTGCGDVFHGIYALGLSEGLPPLGAARLASAAAAVKAELGRGWDGMADRGTVERLLADGAGAA